MQEIGGQLIRLWRSVDCGQSSEGTALASGGFAAGFYLVMSLAASKKKRRTSSAVRAVNMYGPFGDVHAARFIETSANALGLLRNAPAPASESMCTDHATVLPTADDARPATRQARIVRLAEMR